MLHENSDLLTKFKKKTRLKNALLTKQNDRQVLFCTVTSRLLHDDAKIHATSARLYNVLGKLAGNANSFPPIYSDRDLCPPSFTQYFNTLNLHYA